MDMRVMPGRLRGRVQAVPSKSALHRVIVCGTLGGEMPKVPGVEAAAGDVRATACCAAALCGPALSPVLDCGESAATLRFLLPAAAALGRTVAFTGCKRLAARPLGPLIEVLRSHGCRVSADTLPFKVSGALLPGVYALDGDVTSQNVSGLLMALPLLDGDSRIDILTPLVSSGYVEMTLRTMAAFGVHVERFPGGYHVSGGQAYRLPERLPIEGDWSCASFLFVANYLGGVVEVAGLSADSPQPDRAVAALLPRMRQGGLSIDVSQCPDLFPVLAVAACATPGGAVLKNAARLRYKESDRIRTTAAMLEALGGQAEPQPDGLVVRGGGLTGGTVDSAGDHRIAMAAAVAAAACRMPVTVRGAESVAKSYPAFWEDFQRLGGVAHVV